MFSRTKVVYRRGGTFSSASLLVKNLVQLFQRAFGNTL